MYTQASAYFCKTGCHKTSVTEIRTLYNYGTEFLVRFSSRSRSLALKSLLKGHQMAIFFVQNRSLSEIIII